MINFKALRKAMDRMNDSKDGKFGRCGNWKIALGGYDHGYEIYYKDEPVMRVNYELDEYEFYSCDYSDVMFTPDTVPQIKEALDITHEFDNVGDIDDNGDYIDSFGQYVNGVEANVSESGISKRVKFKKIVKESRKPHMWAIDFRNMNTAVHGLFYGADKKEVQSFYNNLKDLNSEEMDGYELEDLMNAYDSIKMIDEINFSRIGRLDSGRYGIEIDNVEYWIINYVAEDLYMESTKRNNKMKFKKIVKESSNVEKFRRSIEAAKNRIIRKVDRNGVVENLGADEVRRLGDDIDHMFLSGDCEKSDELKMIKMLDNFEYWLSTYTGKIVNESVDVDSPRIYVGTYAKYNDGDISGEWVDLTDFAHDYDGFVKHCREIHKDEKDPEFMIQDYEGFPRKWYHEAGLPTEEEFDKIIEISELDDSEKNAYAAYLELDFSDDSIEAFREHYYGTYDGDYDLGMDFVDRIGMPDNPEQYFDYDRFGRDLMYDYHYGDPDNTDSEGNPEDPDHYYDNDGYDMGEYHNDTQVAEDYIDSLGSIEELGKETLNNYFDYASFGRDLLLNDLEESDGYLFWNH